MTKQINRNRNKSFSELNWSPGELLAFDDTDSDLPSPLLLTIPKKIVTGYKDSPQGIKLLYCPVNGEREELTLYSEGDMIMLWSPNYGKGLRFPNFDIIHEGFSQGHAYFVESALAGRGAVQEYLKESKQALSFYAECLESGKLVTERSLLEKLAQKMGFGFVLPSQLRFKKECLSPKKFT